MEKIQCIIISEDAHYKTKVKTFLNKYTNTEVILTNTLMDALMYLDEKPPFKLLIRKPNKPLDAEDIENCRRVVERDMNFRIVVFQKEYKDLTMLLNLNSLRCMQQEKGLFAKMKLKTVLKRLSGK
ncbi:hypothetical protein [Pontimicrobium sp. MEBiC06410]